MMGGHTEGGVEDLPQARRALHRLRGDRRRTGRARWGEARGVERAERRNVWRHEGTLADGAGYGEEAHRRRGAQPSSARAHSGRRRAKRVMRAKSGRIGRSVAELAKRDRAELVR